MLIVTDRNEMLLQKGLAMREDRLIPVREAIEIATGHSVSPSTAWRWTTKGVRGVRLDTRVFGKKILTTIKAVDDFIFAASASRNSDASTAVNQSKADAAKKELQELCDVK